MKDTETWPVADLEKVDACPICAGENNVSLYSGLQDIVFRAAPGRWDFFQCKRCNCIYLNPRPAAGSIWRAYLNYYTHDQGYEHRGLVKHLRNGYLNGLYKINAKWRTSGYWLYRYILPDSIREDAEYQIRNLPFLKGGKELLDVGCGNGKYVKLAMEFGWNAEGIDMDAVAIKHGINQGLKLMQKNVMNVSEMGKTWDVITMAHVIEHVHEPVKLLKDCRMCLKPEGTLWLATPNAEALGHKYYGQFWRGLEVPRHLTIFSRQALEIVLEKAGYEHITWLKRGLVRPSMFMASSQLMNGVDKCKQNALIKLFRASWDSHGDDAHSEELVCIAS